MCEKLSTIVIPDSVTNIGESSFFECPNISDVYYQGTANDWAGVNLNNSNTELSNGRIHFSVTDIESHYYVEVYTEPTCTTEGSGLRKCPCGYESSEAIPMLEHVMVNGVCTSCGIAEIYESSHPYKNDMDETWTIYREGAKSISITFSEDTKTESGCDYIYIYSASELTEGVCDSCIDEYKHDREMCFKVGERGKDAVLLNSFIATMFDADVIADVMFKHLKETRLGRKIDCSKFILTDKSFFSENLVEEVKINEAKKS
jgi:hypothetical protein